jgi:phosphatidylserine decarboxylase
MAKPLPLPVWDRQRGKLVEEWMDDHQPHYESRSVPLRSGSNPSRFTTASFRPGVLRFPSAPEEMGAFAEARYFGWRKVKPDQKFPVKGHTQRRPDSRERRAGTPVCPVRLAPVDYHHVHYSDEGKTLDHQRLGNRLWTVNWHALQSKPDILFANERNVNILETRNFGRLGFVEVDALSVGRIAQVHPLGLPFKRGEERSIFRFGASAIVVFGEVSGPP